MIRMAAGKSIVRRNAMWQLFFGGPHSSFVPLSIPAQTQVPDLQGLANPMPRLPSSNDN